MRQRVVDMALAAVLFLVLLFGTFGLFKVTWGDWPATEPPPQCVMVNDQPCPGATPVVLTEEDWAP